jgi:hypothetical protein
MKKIASKVVDDITMPKTPIPKDAVYVTFKDGFYLCYFDGDIIPTNANEIES